MREGREPIVSVILKKNTKNHFLSAGETLQKITSAKPTVTNITRVYQEEHIPEIQFKGEI